MKAINAIGVGVATAVISTAIITGANHILTKKRAFNYAKSLVGEKGIINLGAGPHRTLLATKVIARSPEVVANLDIVPDGLPNFYQLDLEQIPYPFETKQFDCVFASHILEHLNNPTQALDEMTRIAENVVVVLPHPLSLPSILNPEHKWRVTYDKIREMEKFPNTKVFY